MEQNAKELSEFLRSYQNEMNKYVKTAGGYSVKREDIDKYKNEEDAKYILYELFSNEEFFVSISELIEILKEKTGYDYSAVDETKSIKKQKDVLENIIYYLNIYGGDLYNHIYNFEILGEKYYYYPPEKQYEYYESVRRERVKELNLPKDTYFYERKIGIRMPDDISCGVYLITNIKNGKQYVGQATNIPKRWFEHIESKDNSELHKDMRKLKPNQFAFTVLSYGNPFTLDLEEMKYIEKYDTFENGYNNNRGNVIKARLQEEYLATNNSNLVASDTMMVQAEKLTECNKQSYIESLKDAAQFLIDNAEELIGDIEDITTALNIWICVDNDDVILQVEYDEEIGESKTGMRLAQKRSTEYSF